MQEFSAKRNSGTEEQIIGGVRNKTEVCGVRL